MFAEFPLVWVLAALAIGSGLVALVAWGVPWLKKSQGYIGEKEIEELLLPYAVHAIMAAYRISEASMDELGERLHGVDKRLFARQVYALLPRKIAGLDTRALVSYAQFESLIQLAFDNFDEFWTSKKADFDSLITYWVAKNYGESNG